MRALSVPVCLAVKSELLAHKSLGFLAHVQSALAQAYLAEDGNPFFAMGFDPKGRDRVEWGVTAPPETFIVMGDGTVAFRFIGPLVGSDYEARFVPALEAALAEEAAN
jgi:cytochrome c biogenesis protein CcmG/thiol:disulfide interchange protein DsbE